MFYEILFIVFYYAVLFIAYSKGYLESDSSESPTPEPSTPPTPPSPPPPPPLDSGKDVKDPDGPLGAGLPDPGNLEMEPEYQQLCLSRSCAPAQFEKSDYFVFTEDELKQIKDALRIGGLNFMTVTYYRTTRFIVNEDFVHRNDLKARMSYILSVVHRMYSKRSPPPPSTDAPLNDPSSEIPDEEEEPNMFLCEIDYKVGRDQNFLGFRQVKGVFDENMKLLNTDPDNEPMYFYPSGFTNQCSMCIASEWKEGGLCFCK